MHTTMEIRLTILRSRCSERFSMLHESEPTRSSETDRPEATTPEGPVTQSFQSAEPGDRDAYDRLFPMVYEELRRLAHGHLRLERDDHTLNTTALVHEAYLKLADQTRVQWQNRSHFNAVASQAMRRILINHANRRRAGKRGGGAPHVPLEEAELLFSDRQAEELLALDEALTHLCNFNRRGADVVIYRFFGGLTYDEIAEVMGTSPITVRRSWNGAKSWLRRELRRTLSGWDPDTFLRPHGSGQ